MCSSSVLLYTSNSEEEHIFTLVSMGNNSVLCPPGHVRSARHPLELLPPFSLCRVLRSTLDRVANARQTAGLVVPEPSRLRNICRVHVARVALCWFGSVYTGSRVALVDDLLATSPRDGVMANGHAVPDGDGWNIA